MDRYLRLLRRRDYRLLWTGATISALGDGMSFIALLWLVLDRTGDPAIVGALAATYTAPVVVGGLAAGIILDRFDRRLVLLADNSIRGLAMASVPIAALFGPVSTAQLFIVAAVYGLLYMTSAAGIPSVLPSLVEPDELTTANAMETLSYSLAGLAGPAVAGVAIATISAPAVLAVDAITYGIFVACLGAMRSTPVEANAAAERLGGAPVPASASRAARGLGPAVRFVLATPAILAITLMYMTINIGEGMSNVFLPLYARDVLSSGPATYGLLVTGFTAGVITGAFAVGAIDWKFPLGRSIAVATVLAGTVLLGLTLTPPLAGALAILFGAGFFASSLTAWAQTIRMRLIPPELRGRVFAILRTLMQSTGPIGALIAGFLLAKGPLVPVLATAAILMIVPGVIGLFIPALGSAATAEPARPADQPGVSGDQVRPPSEVA